MFDQRKKTAHATLARKVVRVSHLSGDFRLRSGATSSEYFDKYRFEADPRMLREVTEQFASWLPADFDVLAGLEMGGIPIAMMHSQLSGKPTIFVRKNEKEYGTCRFAEGGDIK